MIMSSPGQSYAVAIFIEHIISDLQISRGLLSTLYTGATLLASFALPMVGRQIDRYGARIMVSIIVVLFGVACVFMGQVQNALMLALGFISIRFLGQGSLVLVSTYVINQWWIQRRGLAMGITGMLMSILGIGAFPILINAMIPAFGWRTTYMLLGIGIVLLMLPIGLLFFRNRPEAYGLIPDAMPSASSTNDTADAHFEENNWTLAEAMRTSIFWIVSAGVATISMLATGLFFHMVSIFADNGLSVDVAAAAFVPIALTTAIMTFLSGILVDRIPARVLLATALIIQSISLLLASNLQGQALILLYGILLGTTSGLVRTVNSVAWATYFGRLHLGSITGVTTTILIAGSALGPMPFGMIHDIAGNYKPMLYGSAALPLLLAIACVFIRKPVRPG